MQILLFIILVILFLYYFYKLTKDDYVFIRKNLSLEQLFDIVFIMLWGSIFTSRVFYFVFHPVEINSFLPAIFSPGGGFSLTGAIIGGVATLYIVAKRKKAPLGRLFDFVTLSFVGILPLGFVIYALSRKQPETYLYLLYAFLYLILAFFYRKFLYPKVLSRTQKEGNVSLLFLLFFSLATLCTSIINPVRGTITIFSIENLFLVGLFLTSVILLFKQERIVQKKR